MPGHGNQCSKYAEVAQLVEQLTRNEQVAGSIPVFGSKSYRLQFAGIV